MRTGRECTFVISWTQTEVDGLRGAPLSALEAGVTWRWTGTPTRVDGPADLLPLDHALGHDELQARAAAAARRILGRALHPARAQSGGTFDDALLNHAFKITDGRRIWSAMLVEVAELARPLLMFVGTLPPSGKPLWVAEGIGHSGHFNRITETPTGVICFTRGTRLRTPAGEVLWRETGSC